MHVQALLSLAALFGAAHAQIQTFNWNCQNSLGPCQNACFAVVCRYYPELLTYDANSANRGPRRTMSGCNKTPCSDAGLSYSAFGNSCDEFPFASTQEGGSGAMLRCVDSTENSSEGGQLGAFYRTINNGDKFGVTIENYSGASYCEDDPICINDGGEFTLDLSGTFINGKRSVARRGFVLNEGRDVQPRKLRKFEGEGGSIHLVIVENPDMPLQVGSEVWSMERGAVKLVREILE